MLEGQQENSQINELFEELWIDPDILQSNLELKLNCD